MERREALVPGERSLPSPQSSEQRLYPPPASPLQGSGNRLAKSARRQAPGGRNTASGFRRAPSLREGRHRQRVRTSNPRSASHPRPPWNGQGFRRSRRGRPGEGPTAAVLARPAPRQGDVMAEGQRLRPGCAPPNCVSRRASKMSTIAPPEVSTAPCSRSSSEGEWIDAHDNLALVGPSGVGKSWLACAIGQKACRDNRSVLYHRWPKLCEDLALARGDGRHPRLIKSLGRADLLILDDFGLDPSTPAPVMTCSKFSRSDTAVGRRSSPPSSPVCLA